jgi:uncharacterized protein YoxC
MAAILFLIPIILFVIYYRIENKKIEKKLKEVEKEIIKKK